jgi:hypothetical protein
MNSFIKINAGDIKEGMCFSAPVFFDDGKNMFLAEGKTVKTYHVAALKRWSIPYVLTYGHELNAVPAPVPAAGVAAAAKSDDVGELEELEEVEEVEPLDDPPAR